MTTHLYTLCWNEADMLDFFFRQYDSWVDRYIIYDDGSTDGSIEILKSHPKVDLRRWNRKFPDSYFMSQQYWLNEIWKESRETADWVVSVDIDEHLFVPGTAMKDFLESNNSQNVTFIPALGYQILSDEFPEATECLVQTRTSGTPDPNICKVSIFNPDEIEETNFSGGRHTANAIGNVIFPKKDKLILFHYKYLGFERTFKKQNNQYSNLGPYDVTMGFFLHYGSTRQGLREFWNNCLHDPRFSLAVSKNPDTYPHSLCWWRTITRWISRAKRFLRSPFFMFKRLKIIFTKYKYHPPAQNFELCMKRINDSPIRKQMYQLIFNGRKDDVIIIANNEDKKGVLVQFLYSQDVDQRQCIDGIQKATTAKEENEKKYQKNFDVFAITNSNKFLANAVEIAKTNNIKLVSRKELIEFISLINIL